MNRSLSLLAAVFATVLPARADWLNFRGLDGTAPAGPGPGAAVKWKTALPGRGLGSPIVVGDRVFVSASSGPQQRRLHVLCFSATTGEKRWERVLQATGRTMCHEKTAVAAPTMASDGQRVFALYSSNDLFAFDLDGNLLWLRGLTVDYANASNSLGMAASPLVVGGVLVVPSENDSESFTAGLDVRTGRNLWKLDRPKMANWTSPVAHQGAALLQSGKGLTAVDPATGSVLWDYTDGASTIPSSAVGGELVFVPSNGLTAIRPKTGQPTPAQEWRVEQINPGTGSPLVLDGKVYAINNAGILNQADPKTGERGFRLRLEGPFSGSPIGAGKFIYAVNEKGQLQIVDTTGEEGSIAQTLELGETVLCTPSLADGALFVRSDATLWRIE
jgi:outer membrane protein assembly factor BamB